MDSTQSRLGFRRGLRNTKSSLCFGKIAFLAVIKADSAFMEERQPPSQRKVLEKIMLCTIKSRFGFLLRSFSADGYFFGTTINSGSYFFFIVLLVFSWFIFSFLSFCYSSLTAFIVEKLHCYIYFY